MFWHRFSWWFSFTIDFPFLWSKHVLIWPLWNFEYYLSIRATFPVFITINHPSHSALISAYRAANNMPISSSWVFLHYETYNVSFIYSQCSCSNRNKNSPYQLCKREKPEFLSFPVLRQCLLPRLLSAIKQLKWPRSILSNSLDMSERLNRVWGEVFQEGVS